MITYNGVEEVSTFNDVYYDMFVELEVDDLFLVDKRGNSLILSVYISRVNVVTFDEELGKLLEILGIDKLEILDNIST